MSLLYHTGQSRQVPGDSFKSVTPLLAQCVDSAESVRSLKNTRTSIQLQDSSEWQMIPIRPYKNFSSQEFLNEVIHSDLILSTELFHILRNILNQITQCNFFPELVELFGAHDVLK